MTRLLVSTALFMAACCDGPPVERSQPRFAGQVFLVGELARVDCGSVFVGVWNEPLQDAAPALFREYDLGDTAFYEEGDALVLRFELDVTHNQAGLEMPLGRDPSLEVRFVETKGGIERVWVAVRPDDMDITVVLRPTEVPKGDFDGDEDVR